MGYPAIARLTITPNHLGQFSQIERPTVDAGRANSFSSLGAGASRLIRFGMLCSIPNRVFRAKLLHLTKTDLSRIASRWHDVAPPDPRPERPRGRWQRPPFRLAPPRPRPAKSVAALLPSPSLSSSRPFCSPWPSSLGSPRSHPRASAPRPKPPLKRPTGPLPSNSGVPLTPPRAPVLNHSSRKPAPA